MKKLIHIACFFLLVFTGIGQAYAQTPVISSVSPLKASFGEIITITGSGFAAQADLRVRFGAVAAEVTEAGPTAIKVKVPAGATYASISVTNLPSGLTAYSSKPFYLSYGGKDHNPMELVRNLPATAKPFDVCACDLDGDGKSDLVASSQSSTSSTTYLNNSTIGGTIDFPARKDIPVGSFTNHVTCGDLDGDGKQDLVYTGTGADGHKVVYMKNISSAGNISFSTPVVLTVIGVDFEKAVIHDIDRDGKPEVILTNKTDSKIYIFKNTSTVGNIGFNNAPVSLTATITSLRGLRVKDLNNDGLPDISISALYANQVNVFLNTSTAAGTISFGAPSAITSGEGLTNHEFEDVDGDGKPDLLTLDYFSNLLNIHLNQSSGSTLAFSTTPQTFPVSAGPYGLELGDLNGDKKIDIAVSANLTNKIDIFINNSTSGALNLSASFLQASFGGNLSNLQVADFDGDAIPDIAAADRSSYNLLRVFKNKNCVFPSIRANGSTDLCNGNEVELIATLSPRISNATVSYQWLKDGAVISTTTSNTYKASTAGSYTVTLSSNDGCSNTSAPLVVNTMGGSTSSVSFDPIPSGICAGKPFTLSVSPAISGATYEWKNDKGFTATTTTNSVTIASADVNLHSGTYTVKVVKDCPSTATSPTVTVSSAPVPNITMTGDGVVCEGVSSTLSTTESFSSYQWRKDGVDIPDAKSSSLTVDKSGSYSVVVTNEGKCEGESGTVNFQVVKPPIAVFEAPTTVCLNQPVKFINKSVLTAGQSATYSWSFGDGKTSSDQSPEHTFTSMGGAPYTVTLKVTYNNINCTGPDQTYTQVVDVVDANNVTIEALGETTFCAGDSVQVKVVGDVAGVSWSNGQTGLTTYAKENGLIKATIQTTAGCSVDRTLEVTALPAPSLEVTAESTDISRGDEVKLMARGGVSYKWEPAISLDNPYIENPVASPIKTTTYKVTATGENGCTAVAEITINVEFSFKVTIPKLYVPAVDQVWSITNIEDYPDVSLTIINKFGRTIFQASPYQNNWNGTENSTSLDEGVYFYVFKDSTGKVIKTGSITVLR